MGDGIVRWSMPRYLSFSENLIAAGYPGFVENPGRRYTPLAGSVGRGDAVPCALNVPLQPRGGQRFRGSFLGWDAGRWDVPPESVLYCASDSSGRIPGSSTTTRFVGRIFVHPPARAPMPVSTRSVNKKLRLIMVRRLSEFVLLAKTFRHFERGKAFHSASTFCRVLRLVFG